MTLLIMQSKCAKSDRIFFDLRIRGPKPSDFDPKSDDLGYQIFKSKNCMLSKFKILSTQQAAAERSMSWMETQLYSNVASRPTLGRHVPPWPDYSCLAWARA